MMFATVSLLVVVAAGCQRQGTQTSPPAADAPGPMAGPDMQVVNVMAKEFAFEPRDVRVKAGMVRFIVRNDGTVEHDFEIVGAAEHGAGHEQQLFAPGATYELEVDLRPGTYEGVCNVPGHRESGMVATIIAE